MVSLISEFLTLDICLYITYDAPLHIPEPLWPSRLKGGGSYTAKITDQSQEHLDWFTKNAAMLNGAKLFIPNGAHWAVLSFSDGHSVLFRVRERSLHLVTELPTFQVLESYEKWDVTRIKPLSERMLEKLSFRNAARTQFP